jgi:hypothetical protein
MTRWFNTLARVALAGVVCVLVLAVLRWGPVWAEPPLDVRALRLGGLAVLLAVVTALTGRERRLRRWRPVAVALAVVVALLAGFVWARPEAGLPARASGPAGELAVLPPGAIEIDGARLRRAAIPAVRKWTFEWAGELRAPRSGTYRLWSEGRGHVRATLDGRVVLEAEGEPLRAGADVPLTAGAHALEVVLLRTGPGPRLRLGWTRPDRRGRPSGLEEPIPPRALGPRTSLWLWRLTDLLAVIAAALVAALVWLVPWDRPRRPPSPRPVTMPEIGWSLAGHTALVVVMSWPLVLDIAGSGVMDRPDGRLNAWILAWDVHALTHAPGRLFRAPIFHPLPDALAFSENLLLPAILAAPALAIGGPVLGYNVVLLLSMIVSGLGAQLLVRRVSGARLAAFVGGAIFAVGAHRWIRLAHLHAQVTLFLPFMLLAFDGFWHRRTLRRALLVGLLLALQALSSVYLGAIAALAFAMATLAALVGGLGRRAILHLVAGAALAGLLLAPVARPYMRMRAFQGMEWTLADVANYATTIESYAASGTRLYGGLTQRHLDPERVQDTLFPGLVPLVLGVVGLAAAPRRYRAVALLASAAAVIVSLGPQTALYRWLHEHLLLVRGVRALSRFSLLVVLALSVLSGLALSGRRRLALPALALALFESTNVPIAWARAPALRPAAPALASGQGAVVYLPAGEHDTEAMLEQTAHWRPLVNGDSGFIPRPYARTLELLQEPLSDDALRLLRALDVRQLVTAGGVADVPAGESAVVPADAPRYPTLWTRDGAVVDLGRAQEVGAAIFELDDRPWIARPRVEASIDGRIWTSVDAQASLADAALALYADPRHGRGEVRFRSTRTRYLRLDPRLPARVGALAAGVADGAAGQWR